MPKLPVSILILSACLLGVSQTIGPDFTHWFPAGFSVEKKRSYDGVGPRRARCLSLGAHEN